MTLTSGLDTSAIDYMESIARGFLHILLTIVFISLLSEEISFASNPSDDDLIKSAHFSKTQLPQEDRYFSEYKSLGVVVNDLSGFGIQFQNLFSDNFIFHTFVSYGDGHDWVLMDEKSVANQPMGFLKLERSKRAFLAMGASYLPPFLNTKNFQISIGFQINSASFDQTETYYPHLCTFYCGFDLSKAQVKSNRISQTYISPSYSFILKEPRYLPPNSDLTIRFRGTRPETVFEYPDVRATPVALLEYDISMNYKF